MITDAIISWFQQILSFLVNLIPSAPIIAAGQGASSGTACCVTFMIDTLFSTIGTMIGTTANLANTPLAIMVDWGTIGFVLGCLMAFLIAFFLVKILMQFWLLVKW